jgi:hypothetical protein
MLNASLGLKSKLGKKPEWNRQQERRSFIGIVAMENVSVDLLLIKATEYTKNTVGN